MSAGRVATWGGGGAEAQGSRSTQVLFIPPDPEGPPLPLLESTAPQPCFPSLESPAPEKEPLPLRWAGSVLCHPPRLGQRWGPALRAEPGPHLCSLPCASLVLLSGAGPEKGAVPSAAAAGGPALPWTAPPLPAEGALSPST